MADRKTMLEVEGLLQDGNVHVYMGDSAGVDVRLRPDRIAISDEWMRGLLSKRVRVTVEELDG